jgi:hypothetical protein
MRVKAIGRPGPGEKNLALHAWREKRKHWRTKQDLPFAFF